MKARMGVPKAMTATAHKLAGIVYHMITTRQEYDATIFQTTRATAESAKNSKASCTGQNARLSPSTG